jgi:hypothetical protein
VHKEPANLFGYGGARRVDVCQHNTGAIRSEAACNGQTKPACGAGYQRSFSV